MIAAGGDVEEPCRPLLFLPLVLLHQSATVCVSLLRERHTNIRRDRCADGCAMVAPQLLRRLRMPALTH